MEPELIVKSIMGLIALLALLIFLLFYNPNKSKKRALSHVKHVEEIKSSKEVEETNFKVLIAMIKNKKSDAKKLEYALSMILKHHGKVHKKMGLRAHPEFAIYENIIFNLCRHPHTNKDLIVNFDREFLKLNPDYKQEINDAITKGLNSRGI